MVLASVLGLLATTAWRDGRAHERILAAGRIPLPSRHVHDRAALLSIWKRAQFEQYLARIEQESDIDIQFLFVDDLHGSSIDRYAAAAADSLHIRTQGHEARALLLVYDMRGRQLRIEVGYGLEPWFPDSFVGFLIEDHVREFFAAEDPATGLLLTARILQQRIREAALGGDYDPRPVARLRDYSHVSGGAGASGSTPLGASGAFLEAQTSHRLRQYFAPQPTPAAAFERYLEWLAAGATDPDVGLFTPETQLFFADLPLSRGYIAHVLMLYADKGYRVEERDGLAMVYFTSTPFASPCFFRRTNAGWEYDVLGELHDTQELVGQPYTWTLVDGGDEFADAFLSDAVERGDLHVLRWPAGDNRPLPVRER